MPVGNNGLRCFINLNQHLSESPHSSPPGQHHCHKHLHLHAPLPVKSTRAAGDHIMFGIQFAQLRHVCGRSQRQLWGNKKIIFGVKSSDDKRSPIKSPRRWEPNVIQKTVYSQILDRRMKIKMTARVLRCIDKAGSFDNYILNTKSLNSELGEKLKAEMKAILNSHNKT
eukprot:gene6854-399_t